MLRVWLIIKNKLLCYGLQLSNMLEPNHGSKIDNFSLFSKLFVSFPPLFT